MTSVIRIFLTFSQCSREKVKRHILEKKLQPEFIPGDGEIRIESDRECDLQTYIDDFPPGGGFVFLPHQPPTKKSNMSNFYITHDIHEKLHPVGFF